jgi:hypothetical protein
VDIGTLLDPTHSLSFLLGTAVGAAGKYFADLFTDQRKRQEDRASQEALFRKTQNAMPALLAEMKADVQREREKHMRELVVLPNERVIFNSDRERFAYFESQHPGLRDKLATLVEAGYISVVREHQNAPIYRMSESFVERLLGET